MVRLAPLFPRQRSQADVPLVETTSRDALTDEALSTQITHLWQRTDEQSLRIEIARLLVVLARLPEACAPLATDERAVRAVAGLLAVGTQQEVLLAEGVMALALLAKAEAGGESWHSACIPSAFAKSWVDSSRSVRRPRIRQRQTPPIPRSIRCKPRRSARSSFQHVYPPSPPRTGASRP